MIKKTNDNNNHYKSHNFHSAHIMRDLLLYVQYYLHLFLHIYLYFIYIFKFLIQIEVPYTEFVLRQNIFLFMLFTRFTF